MIRPHHPESNDSQQHGFTLIELVIVVAIIGLLASLAVSSYSRYVIKTNRAAAAAVVLGIANRQEQHYLDARQYAADVAALGFALPPEIVPNYTITTTANNAATPPSFTVTATPIGNQLAKDSACGTLTLSSNGTKSVSGTGGVANCW